MLHTHFRAYFCQCAALLLLDYLMNVTSPPATTPTLSDANLRYHEALDWRKMDKEDAASFLKFVHAVLIEL